MPVRVSGPSGEADTYALLDGGSTVTVIDKNFAHKLGLRGKQLDMSIRGIWRGAVSAKCEKLSFTVKGTLGERKVEHALAVSNLDLPHQSLSQRISHYVKERAGIEINSYVDARPLILIGQDNWSLLHCSEARQLNDSGLVVSRSALGWVIHGYTREDRELSCKETANIVCCNTEEPKEIETQENAKLDRLIQDHFDIENLGVSVTAKKSSIHDRANAILESTTRKINNEWETGLLWKSGSMPDINSRATAMRRLLSLEKRLDANPEFAALFYKEIDRLIANGYAVKVSKETKRPRVWYVPHFGVQNVNKPGKVRLVFDAAAKTKGVSLNDLLETGPDLLEALLGVLLRFRQYPIGVIADIKDMYLRIKMIKRDRGAQRFLWRGADRQREPDEYENTSLIFGSKSSPCSAIYVKNKNAERFAAEKPDAVRSIIRNSYMDDYLASGRTVEEMQQRVKDVIAINKEANFNMHGWASNDPRVVSDVRDENKLNQNGKANLCDEEERVLGLYWDMNADALSFNVGLNKIREELARGEVPPTKREFFSVAMSVYDPLGILAPFILQSKFIMKDVWRSGVKWDSKIREKEFRLWLTWLKNLVEMKHCRIPRCYNVSGLDDVKTQLHVFCDASLKAFAAAAYLRSESRDGKVTLALIMAKSRIAPVKPMTVPRLELQAALLGARVASIIEKELEITVRERVFWSDSGTVLHWIRGDPSQKQMFVANRLGEICELTKVAEWRWVPTGLNPADDATRASGLPMKSDDRWLLGPKFLLEEPRSWPKPKKLDDKEKRAIDELETRKEFIGTCKIDLPDKWNTIDARYKILGWDRIANLAMVVRKYFYIWRDNACNRSKGWKSRSRAKRVKLVERLKQKREVTIEVPSHRKRESEDERIIESEKIWYRVVQSTYFLREMNLLKKGKELPRGSKLIGLDPFIDSEGFLRAKGRVEKIESENGERVEVQIAPIILDASHFATKLLINDFHERYDHANNQTVLNELRQHFHIIGLRTRLRWLSKKCRKCRERRAQPTNPKMAALPKSRLAYKQRPFAHCGIDYFGPMEVKIGRRREKRWGVLFTCMTTRAVHLELASTLTASSAIMAIQRLASRRGFPRHLYSDNGTNFVKADKEIKEAIKAVKTPGIRQRRFAAKHRFEWHFNPPDAPHMGGAWERLIRSVKTALNHALDLRDAPTEEVLHTLLVEIEHMVNSRPLTHVSVDPRDEEALTPNHFLIGSSSGHLSFDKYETEIFYPRKAFETAQNLANRFWNRWLRDYLPSLLPRNKWHSPTVPLRVGDIVLVIDYQAPRNSWRKGRVIELYPNRSDDVVRVVKVRTGKKDFLRPVHKLVRIFDAEH